MVVDISAGRLTSSWLYTGTVNVPGMALFENNQRERQSCPTPLTDRAGDQVSPSCLHSEPYRVLPLGHDCVEISSGTAARRNRSQIVQSNLSHLWISSFLAETVTACSPFAAHVEVYTRVSSETRCGPLQSEGITGPPRCKTSK